jgi:hypothetical protein
MKNTTHASGVGSSIRISEFTTIEVAATPANDTHQGRSRYAWKNPVIAYTKNNGSRMISNVASPRKPTK